ncbi:MAG TPA: FtsX-like permease family protein [Thermomicrobiales bacterium]|nr:FtsX-like permease family protein [Thermomicrobiales bacterium]
MGLTGMLTRKALADVTRRKGRTLLAVLGIALGVLGLTAVNQATALIGGAFFYSADATAVPNVTFTVDALPPAVAAAIRGLPDVGRFQTRLTYNTDWVDAPALEGQRPVIEIDGYDDPRRVDLGAFRLVAGRLPGPGEIVLDESDRAIAPVAPGATITVAAPDGRPVALRVVGLARTRGVLVYHPRARAMGYMDIAALRRLLGPAGGAPASSAPAPSRVLGVLTSANTLPRGAQILIQSSDPNAPQRTHDEVARILGDAGVTVRDSYWKFTSFNADARLGVVGMLALMRLLAGLALLLVSMLLCTTVTTLLAEQVAIIGILKALGGTRWRIARGYLLTVGLYSIMGTALGLGLGLLLGYALAARLAGTVHYSVGSLQLTADVGPFQAAPGVLAAGLAAGLLLPPLAAMWPLWNGTRITVREALASHGVRGGAAARPPRWAPRLGWVPQTAWLGLRGLWRRPARTAVTLLALGLAAAAFLAVQITNTSLGASLDHHYTVFHSDARVNVADGRQLVPTRQLIANLEALPGVERAEPIDPVIVTIARRELLLFGLPAETQLYRPRLVAGRWLAPRERNTIVVNDAAARRLGLRVGQQVALHTDDVAPDEGHDARWTLVGIVHETYDVSPTANATGRLGLAFTTLDNLNLGLRHAPPDAVRDWLWIRTRDHTDRAVREVGEQAAGVFRRAGLLDAAYRPWRQVQAQETGALPVVYLLFDAVAVLVALVGLLSMALTLAAAVLERRREIGILRSLGATGRRVGVVFWIEALALALLAWGVGAGLGVPGGGGLVRLLATYFQAADVAIAPALLPLTLLFTLAVASVASIGPALAAARLRIGETLRYE